MKKLFVECLFKKDIFNNKRYLRNRKKKFNLLLIRFFCSMNTIGGRIVYKKRLFQISDTSQSSIERIIRSSYFSSSFLEK